MWLCNHSMPGPAGLPVFESIVSLLDPPGSYWCCFWNLRSRFLPWCHSWRRWRWDTANTKTLITIWSTPPMSRRLYTTCYSRPEWWWVDWNVYLSVKTNKQTKITQTRHAVRHCLTQSWKALPYPHSILISPPSILFLFINTSNPYTEKGFASGFKNTSTRFCENLITWINNTLPLVITFQPLKPPYHSFTSFILFFVNYDVAGGFFSHQMTNISSLSVVTLGHSFHGGGDI